MHEQFTIDHYMTPDPCGVDEALTLQDAADRMQANNIHHLVVVSEEDNRLAGVVSLADLELAAAVSDKGADKTPVKAAARPALVVSPGTRVSDVARRMEHDHLECAVVLGEDDYVAGIFTITDALRALREAEAGRPVEPEVVPTHRVRVEASRKQVLPTTRVKRMLREHSASPSPNDGTALGKVFP